MKRSLGIGGRMRRGLGRAALAGVIVIVLGLDTTLLTQVSFASTAKLEQDQLTASGNQATPVEALPVEGVLPSLAGAVQWLNSPPLTAQGLKGKVVLVDFWTYTCINCLRTLPYVRAWAAKYKNQGLVVIGVHTPEFGFEHNVDNVRKAVARLGVTYPVAIDNDEAVWRAFDNEYWPAQYFVDADGRIRHHHFGEGDYAGSERVIQQLLAEAGRAGPVSDLVAADSGRKSPHS